ncbi:MAG: PilZ domain-containing protein [Chromatiaceae bacterium]
MDDRRKINRIDAHNARLAVHNTVDGEPVGIIGNLSPGGIMLITHKQLYPDGILQLTVDVPETVDFGPISMGMKILWCIPANSPDEYWAGLETLDMSSDSGTALQALLDHLSHAG